MGKSKMYYTRTQPESAMQTDLLGEEVWCTEFNEGAGDWVIIRGVWRDAVTGANFLVEGKDGCLYEVNYGSISTREPEDEDE